ncbi:MAG: hypothetical protein U0670_14810 [Anaerolineae bacterium]
MAKSKKQKPKSKRDRLAAYEELSKQPGFFMVNPRTHRSFLEGKRSRIGSELVMNAVFGVSLFIALGAAIIIVDIAPHLTLLGWGGVCGGVFIIFGFITWIPWLDTRNERLSREGWVLPGTIVSATLIPIYDPRAVYPQIVRDPDGIHADAYRLNMSCRFTTPDGEIRRTETEFTYLRWAWWFGFMNKSPSAAPPVGSPVAVLYVDDKLCRVM